MIGFCVDTSAELWRRRPDVMTEAGDCGVHVVRLAEPAFAEVSNELVFLIPCSSAIGFTADTSLERVP